MKNNHAFTIVELLVVLVIFSSLIAAAFLASSVFTNSLIKTQGDRNEHFKLVKLITLMDKSIKSMSDYYVKSEEYNSPMLVPYVAGDSQELRYISMFSIFGYASDVAVRLKLEFNDGLTTLSISESPLKNKMVTKLTELLEYPITKTMHRFQGAVNFSYLHRKPFTTELYPLAINNDFSSQFHSTLERGLPKAVRVDFQAGDNWFVFTPKILNTRKAIKVNSIYNHVEG